MGDGEVIYHAVDTEMYSPSKRNDELKNSLKIELNCKYVALAMGGFVPDRGFHIIVKGIAHLRRTGVDVGLVIKGYGANQEYAAHIRELASRLDLPLKIIERHLTDEEIAELFASVDVYVRATFSDGFGIAPLEAQSCGTPVVVTDCCSLKEIFADSSLRFKKGDYVGLAEQVSKILTDTSVRDELVKAGMKNAHRFLWSVKMRRYVAYYNSVLRRR